jgi:hypothetical protein
MIYGKIIGQLYPAMGVTVGKLYTLMLSDGKRGLREGSLITCNSICGHERDLGQQLFVGKIVGWSTTLDESLGVNVPMAYIELIGKVLMGSIPRFQKMQSVGVDTPAICYLPTPDSKAQLIKAIAKSKM